MVGSGIPFYDDMIVKTLTEVNALLTNFVFNGYSALSADLNVPLGVITMIYIAIFGLSVMQGWVQIKMGNFVKAVLKISFIYMAVTQWSFVSEYLVGFVNGAVGNLGDALISASPVHIPGALGLQGAMQETLIQFTTLGSTVFNSGGISNFGGWIDGLVLWGFGYAIVGISLFEIILAKVMLAVLFVFTPLMAIFCYFKPFQGIFDRWLGAITGFALLQLFVTAASALALSLSYWWMAMHLGETAMNIGNYGTLPIIILGIVCIGLILKAAQIAQSIGGIVCTSSGAGMVSGIVGGFVGSSLNGMRGASSGARAAAGLASLSKVGVKKTIDASESMMESIQSSLRRGE